MSVRYEECILGALEGGFGEFLRVERKSVRGDLKSAEGVVSREKICEGFIISRTDVMIIFTK